MAAVMTRKRLMTPGILIVGGGAMAVGAWLGDEAGLAIGLAVLTVAGAVVGYIWAGGRGDTAAILRGAGDERQRLLDLYAVAFAAIVMILLCIAGAVIDLARGGNGDPWALICGTGGVAYAVGFAFVRRRS